MAPVPTAVRESAVQLAPILPYATIDRLLGPPKEIVVDWQMPTDWDRR